MHICIINSWTEWQCKSGSFCGSVSQVQKNMIWILGKGQSGQEPWANQSSWGDFFTFLLTPISLLRTHTDHPSPYFHIPFLPHSTYFFYPKLEAVYSFKTSVHLFQTTWHHIPKGSIFTVPDPRTSTVRCSVYSSSSKTKNQDAPEVYCLHTKSSMFH
jgi:hypothetical protein